MGIALPQRRPGNAPQEYPSMLRMPISSDELDRIEQSVFSLENARADYFEPPAPEWKHGSRFSRGYLEVAIQSAGFRMLDGNESELQASEQLWDCGTSFPPCEL